VDATDGSIGKIHAATSETDAAYVVVDTGPWIFGKKRLIPAGAITDVNHDDKTVIVAMTKDAIKAAPDYDASHWNEETRNQHADHYGRYSSW
jgi:hypothetical protein